MSNNYDDNDVTFRICAVLPASGTGSRMAMQIPKQYYEIAGKPLLMYTVEAFDKISWIEKVVIVVPEDYVEYTKQLIKTHNIRRAVVATGSQTRHRSIYNGLTALKMNGSDPPDVVIIHDAVRPLVNEDILRSVAMAAMIYGAAGCTRPLVSTVIKASEDNILDHSLQRSQYRASETPQAFQYDVIKEAYDKCTDYDFDYGTECLHLANKYTDSTVKLVDGPPSLWKITYKKDLYAFEGIIKGL
ncbi:uncharacterized protein TRIADDRAFT_21810 [Trichoplax adhaerens]|uniref:2-C-methyl-D-erythritol 4-phosphate cytidylyltransferase n=1 Tax=Trichoplax adhaerens TaxID=10228 RepID=B3RQD7_TRIAD|nr:hypothetical protein TRIADDRAFT_21810 [Trichoplax adhaerens]EDV27813.1 hypothetical protein TRIADDRAFT_21810 [Trichoplax adhaerens]|eukprot:XP_002109647.1 hypothetical protein TRIADDRAFT_21810 [Trichoplax adhaerens]